MREVILDSDQKVFEFAVHYFINHPPCEGLYICQNSGEMCVAGALLSHMNNGTLPPEMVSEVSHIGVAVSRHENVKRLLAPFSLLLVDDLQFVNDYVAMYQACEGGLVEGRRACVEGYLTIRHAYLLNMLALVHGLDTTALDAIFGNIKSRKQESQ